MDWNTQTVEKLVALFCTVALIGCAERTDSDRTRPGDSNQPKGKLAGIVGSAPLSVEEITKTNTIKLQQLTCLDFSVSQNDQAIAVVGPIGDDSVSFYSQHSPILSLEPAPFLMQVRFAGNGDLVVLASSRCVYCYSLVDDTICTIMEYPKRFPDSNRTVQDLRLDRIDGTNQIVIAAGAANRAVALVAVGDDSDGITVLKDSLRVARAVCASPDGSLVAVAGMDRQGHSLWVWKVDDKRLIMHIPKPGLSEVPHSRRGVPSFGSEFQSLAFSDNNRVIAVGYQNHSSIHVFEVASGKLVTTIDNDYAERVYLTFRIIPAIFLRLALRPLHHFTCP